jgi:mRNA interferase MazF
MKVGDIALVPFPTVEATIGKLRPVLLVSAVPGDHDDFVVCMISSRVYQAVPAVDVLVSTSDKGFAETGLKVSSVIRVGRLATLSKSAFEARLGAVREATLKRVLARARALFRSDPLTRS